LLEALWLCDSDHEGSLCFEHSGENTEAILLWLLDHLLAEPETAAAQTP